MCSQNSTAVLQLPCCQGMQRDLVNKTSYPSIATRPSIIMMNLPIGFLTAVNCYKVKTVKTVQDLFSLLKILALITIILIGSVWLAYGNVENLGNAMQNTSYR